MKFYSIWLLFLNSAVFVIEGVYPSMINSFALVPSVALSQPWMFVTSMFLHADLEHLFYNMFGLGLFGIVLEAVVGSKRFLYVYFTSGIMGSVASFIFYSASMSLGASGAIMGIMGALAMLRPKLVIWIGMPLPMIMLAGVYLSLDLVGFFNPTDSVGYAAHLAGISAGIAFGLFWRKKLSIKTKAKKKAEKVISDEEIGRWEDEWM